METFTVEVHSNIDRFRSFIYNTVDKPIIPRKGDTIESGGLDFEVTGVKIYFDRGIVSIYCDIPRHLYINGELQKEIAKKYLGS